MDMKQVSAIVRKAKEPKERDEYYDEATAGSEAYPPQDPRLMTWSEQAVMEFLQGKSTEQGISSLLAEGCLTQIPGEAPTLTDKGKASAAGAALKLMSDNVSDPDVKSQVLDLVNEYTGVGYTSLDDMNTKSAIFSLLELLTPAQLTALYPQVEKWVVKRGLSWKDVQRAMQPKTPE